MVLPFFERYPIYNLEMRLIRQKNIIYIYYKLIEKLHEKYIEFAILI